jgi:hypothetical protein
MAQLYSTKETNVGCDKNQWEGISKGADILGLAIS